MKVAERHILGTTRPPMGGYRAAIIWSRFSFSRLAWVSMSLSIQRLGLFSLRQAPAPGGRPRRPTLGREGTRGAADRPARGGGHVAE